ncbi:uncharacterized protein LOC113552843 isoform X4 [Rhopalosiphum maidis]|uniref:uncharacterized protein LOC113552843 isoform X4 n=1 Tax=Rhopalosiphum maidis TaxID=43146 RepID=UPI000F007726|nr:uncharacterized protein LOC113552843 isoform X4 [Rhopalosiphum maidis]
MENTDEPPARDGDQPSEDDSLDPEELVEDQHYFDKLQVHLQSFLPFLTKVIDNRELLEIQPDHVSKLQCLYELVDGKRLSPDRLKTCRKVFYDLYDSYSSPLNYYLPQDFKTSWMKETKLNDNEQKIFSEVDCTLNKSNQNQNSKSELSNKISVPSTSHDKMVNILPDSLDDLTPNNENTINKNLENFKISDSSSSKNLLNDSMPKKDDLPEFSDSRLRLNKIIGFAANASIEKLNKSDASIPHTELTTQIFNEIIEQNNGPVLYKDMLKGINIDDIDVNYVKNVIEGIKKASCVEPVQPPPLPPSDLMDLGASRVNLITSTESNSNEIVTHDNILLSKSTTTSCAQTNTEINKLHKINSSNDIRQKFISALKPGTLIDLENSKVSRTSLHIESLRPVIKANEKSNDFMTSVADVSVPRDPRIRNKSLLSSENSVSQINTHPSLISNVQNTFSTNIPTLFASNIDNSNTTLFETRAQEMSGYNDPSLPNHINIKLSNQPFFSEHNSGNSIHFKNRPFPQNQNRRNDHQKNDFNLFSNSTQMHVTPSHSEPMVKYCEPVPYKSHTNDIVSKRDPRSLKNISVINRVQFRNYKEYREAKYGKEQKGIEKNKQMNHIYEKIEKNNIINSSYNTFGIVNETANIKSFKIPKIKHNEDLIDNKTIKDSKPKTFESNKNNVDVLKAEKNSKIVKKTNTILKQHIEDGQKTEIKKSYDLKKTDEINIDKNIEIEITENSNIDEDLKMKIMVNNNSENEEKYPEINLEKITVNIPSEIKKDELDSKSEQNNILIEPIKNKKPKKPKKYSKEKEFEKIVKEAVESSYDNECGPRTRTRFSLLKKDETLKTSKVNKSKSELKKSTPSKNNKKLESGECSKNLDNVSILNMKDDIKPIEIGHNIISSTSKEQSEVVNSTTTEILSRSQEENLVSSNEINSTADNPKIDEKVLIDILKNPKFMTVISIFQDENKMEKLNKLLESSDVNSNNDQLKNKDILDEEQLNIDKQKKLKRKMKKEKRKRKKMKKNLSEESSNEESINDISDDNNLNQAENIVITKKKNDTLNELNKGNISSDNVNDHSSADQHKLKAVKRKKSKETYGNFKILKDKCKPELKDLKIVLAKYDKNIKRIENCNLGISSTNNDILINNKPINTEKAQEIKPKKPFLGPLSVKLARQKMEIERNNSKNKRDVKNKFKFETKSDGKGLKSTNFYNRNSKLISETLTSIMIEQPIVVLSPLPDLKPFEENISNKSAVQNQNTSTVIESNVHVSKPEFKKARLSELDKLHADISEMFDCEAVLNASNIRQCRTNKQIDYVNTNIVLSKKKKASNIEQVDCNDDQIELICGVEKPKNTKKKVKKSTVKLNTKKKYSKQSMANKTLPPVIVKTAVLNKMSNKQPNKFKKKREGNKKFKKSSRNQLNNSINNVVLNDESELNDVSNNVISTEIMPKVLSENDFKDKSYFQTSDNILECKFCNYKDKGLNIVRHYKIQHCREEVLPSRLSKNCIESLIHQSIKENFGYQNSLDSKTFSLGSVNDNYTCVFCQVVFHDYFKFHNHITSHTGEYRFKCKMCNHIYSNEDELDIHILEHTDYDKTNGISHLVYPNPIWSKVVFGYLCSFCYYVQLDYNNIVKHMASRHFYEDKKLNSHWTVIRISMSLADENYIDSSISFDTLEGCLPPIEADQVISKKNEDQNQSLTVRDLIIQSKKQIQSDSISSIKKEYVEQNINEILPQTIIDENLSEIPIFENLPDLTIDNNSAKSSIDKNPPELNNDENPPHLTIDKNSAKSSIDKDLPGLNNDENLPESVIDVNPPESNMLTYLPDQNYQHESRISTEEFDITNSEYTLKENSTKCVLAGLSCELINSMLLFKCSVSSCLENQFSTVIFNDFYKHINQNHRFVVWDGKCKACHHNFKLVSEQYYVKNAFEHLVSHHLILKSNEQSNSIINLGGSKVDQSLSSCLDMAKNTPIIVEKSLRVRCLPGDTLSIHKPSNSSISNICDMSVNKPPSDQSNSIDKNVNLSINHGSNEGRFPFLSSCNGDVKSLKVKVNTFKMNSSASDNNDLNMWMKTKTNCELILPNSEIFLEAGQQIVNNGIPIDGTIYLIDTAYRKDYEKKVRDLPMNVMKTKLAFNEMSALPRLLGLFKCMDRTCTKIFNSKELFKLHMKLHFSNTEKKKKNQIYNVEQFKMCAYCFKMFDDEESLTNHIVDKYTFCEYFCPYCFYRAYTASHVLVHQSVIHTKISKHLIIKLEYDDGACNYPKETLSVVDFKEFVLPYKCNVGCCAFSCYLHNEFTVHLNEEHQQCDKFCCYICANEDDGEGFFALHPSLMITHFKLHNLNKYQCIFCLFGSEIIDSMIKHLAFEHFEYEPLCLERSTVSNNCDSKNIKNLKILRLKKVIENGIIEIVNLPADTVSLPEVLPQKSKKRSIECPDVLSVAMKSARIDEESQPSDTIVITVPDRAQMTESSTSLSIDNEFIMIDDVKQNDMQESLKIDCIWSESKKKEKDPKVSSNDDIIVIDDEDEVDLSEKEGLEDSSKQICLEREESTNGSIKTKRLAFPIIELDKLFVCKECEKIFSNGDIYFTHLNECPFWDSAAGKKCMYCVKVFKTQMNMTEHIKLHGPDRFNCYLCNINVPSQRAITHHMKHIHKITNLDFVPKHPNYTNLNKDNFIVYGDKTVEQKKQKLNNLLTCNKCSFKGNTRKVIMSHMKDVHNAEKNVDCEDNSYGKIMPYQPNDTNNSVNSLIPQKNTSLKRKRSTNSGNQKGSLKVKPIIKDKTKNLCFSPDTIDSIPKSHIFSDPIGCLLCTYNTKVRSNLIIHLNGHTKGRDNTTKEIVNPVPSIGKSELMFDKMINLSASSFDAMNTEKMKRDELDKKIVEVAPDDNFKTEIFPQFVPKNMRYKCSIPLCNYTGMTEEMLKSHISILHSTYQCYMCPHCVPPCITSKTIERNQIEFHLMHHGENLYKCQYCDYIDFNRVEMRTHMRNTHLSEITNSVQSNMIVIRKTMLEDDSIDRGRSKVPSNVARWVCNICSTGMRYTENEITSHILIAHKVTNMFKCPMCQFENKDDNASTFEEHYKSQHPSVAVKCLRVFEMITDKEESHKQYLGGAENILEQQALESIEPTLVPPTCRGIPIDSTPLKMNNKSRGMSKSPKSATKSSSIQPHKQKTLIDVFNKNDKLGTISSNGHFVCPKCYVFETINIELFREHLYKEVNYKTWKCLKCFEISDSPKKMAWHVKKHGIGSKYEKIEDGEKLKWVDRVIGHQHLLLTEFNKNSKAKHVKSVESNKTVIVNNKRTSYSPIKKKNTEREKKVILVPQLSPDPVSNDDIINLIDDSDDE